MRCISFRSVLRFCTIPRPSQRATQKDTASSSFQKQDDKACEQHSCILLFRVWIQQIFNYWWISKMIPKSYCERVNISSLNQFLLFWGRELIGSVSSTISQVFRQLSINPSQLRSMEGGHYTTIQISNPDRFLQIFWHQTQNICVLQHLYQISSKMLLDKCTRVRQNQWF